MVRRVCRELNTRKNTIVLNDEVHHCYRRKPDGEDEALMGDERAEAKQRDEEARIWIAKPASSKIAVKVINLYGDEVLKGFEVKNGHLLPEHRVR